MVYSRSCRYFWPFEYTPQVLIFLSVAIAQRIQFLMKCPWVRRAPGAAQRKRCSRGLGRAPHEWRCAQLHEHAPVGLAAQREGCQRIGALFKVCRFLAQGLLVGCARVLSGVVSDARTHVSAPCGARVRILSDSPPLRLVGRLIR